MMRVHSSKHVLLSRNQVHHTLQQTSTATARQADAAAMCLCRHLSVSTAGPKSHTDPAITIPRNLRAPEKTQFIRPLERKLSTPYIDTKGRRTRHRHPVSVSFIHRLNPPSLLSLPRLSNKPFYNSAALVALLNGLGATENPPISNTAEAGTVSSELEYLLRIVESHQDQITPPEDDAGEQSEIGGTTKKRTQSTPKQKPNVDLMKSQLSSSINEAEGVLLTYLFLDNVVQAYNTFIRYHQHIRISSEVNHCYLHHPYSHASGDNNLESTQFEGHPIQTPVRTTTPRVKPGKPGLSDPDQPEVTSNQLRVLNSSSSDSNEQPAFYPINLALTLITNLLSTDMPENALKVFQLCKANLIASFHRHYHSSPPSTLHQLATDATSASTKRTCVNPLPFPPSLPLAGVIPTLMQSLAASAPRPHVISAIKELALDMEECISFAEQRIESSSSPSFHQKQHQQHQQDIGQVQHVYHLPTVYPSPFVLPEPALLSLCQWDLQQLHFMVAYTMSASLNRAADYYSPAAHHPLSLGKVYQQLVQDTTAPNHEDTVSSSPSETTPASSDTIDDIDSFYTNMYGKSQKEKAIAQFQQKHVNMKAALRQLKSSKMKKNPKSSSSSLATPLQPQFVKDVNVLDAISKLGHRHGVPPLTLAQQSALKNTMPTSILLPPSVAHAAAPVVPFKSTILHPYAIFPQISELNQRIKAASEDPTPAFDSLATAEYFIQQNIEYLERITHLYVSRGCGIDLFARNLSSSQSPSSIASPTNSMQSSDFPKQSQLSLPTIITNQLLASYIKLSNHEKISTFVANLCTLSSVYLPQNRTSLVNQTTFDLLYNYAITHCPSTLSVLSASVRLLHHTRSQRQFEDTILREFVAHQPEAVATVAVDEHGKVSIVPSSNTPPNPTHDKINTIHRMLLSPYGGKDGDIPPQHDALSSRKDDHTIRQNESANTPKPDNSTLEAFTGDTPVMAAYRGMTVSDHPAISREMLYTRLHYEQLITSPNMLRIRVVDNEQSEKAASTSPITKSESRKGDHKHQQPSSRVQNQLALKDGQLSDPNSLLSLKNSDTSFRLMYNSINMDNPWFIPYNRRVQLHTTFASFPNISSSLSKPTSPPVLIPEFKDGQPFVYISPYHYNAALHGLLQPPSSRTAEAAPIDYAMRLRVIHQPSADTVATKPLTPSDIKELFSDHFSLSYFRLPPPTALAVELTAPPSPDPMPAQSQDGSPARTTSTGATGEPNPTDHNLAKMDDNTTRYETSEWIDFIHNLSYTFDCYHADISSHILGLTHRLYARHGYLEGELRLAKAKLDFDRQVHETHKKLPQAPASAFVPYGSIEPLLESAIFSSTSDSILLSHEPAHTSTFYSDLHLSSARFADELAQWEHINDLYHFKQSSTTDCHAKEDPTGKKKQSRPSKSTPKGKQPQPQPQPQASGQGRPESSSSSSSASLPPAFSSYDTSVPLHRVLDIVKGQTTCHATPAPVDFALRQAITPAPAQLLTSTSFVDRYQEIQIRTEALLAAVNSQGHRLRLDFGDAITSTPADPSHPLLIDKANLLHTMLAVQPEIENSTKVAEDFANFHQVSQHIDVTSVPRRRLSLPYRLPTQYYRALHGMRWFEAAWHAQITGSLESYIPPPLPMQNINTLDDYHHARASQLQGKPVQNASENDPDGGSDTQQLCLPQLTPMQSLWFQTPHLAPKSVVESIIRQLKPGIPQNYPTSNHGQYSLLLRFCETQQFSSAISLTLLLMRDKQPISRLYRDTLLTALSSVKDIATSLPNLSRYRTPARLVKPEMQNSLYWLQHNIESSKNRQDWIASLPEHERRSGLWEVATSTSTSTASGASETTADDAAEQDRETCPNQHQHDRPTARSTSSTPSNSHRPPNSSYSFRNPFVAPLFATIVRHQALDRPGAPHGYYIPVAKAAIRRSIARLEYASVKRDAASNRKHKGMTSSTTTGIQSTPVERFFQNYRNKDTNIYNNPTGDALELIVDSQQHAPNRERVLYTTDVSTKTAHDKASYDPVFVPKTPLTKAQRKHLRTTKQPSANDVDSAKSNNITSNADMQSPRENHTTPPPAHGIRIPFIPWGDNQVKRWTDVKLLKQNNHWLGYLSSSEYIDFHKMMMICEFVLTNRSKILPTYPVPRRSDSSTIEQVYEQVKNRLVELPPEGAIVPAPMTPGAADLLQADTPTGTTATHHASTHTSDAQKGSNTQVSTQPYSFLAPAFGGVQHSPFRPPSAGVLSVSHISNPIHHSAVTNGGSPFNLTLLLNAHERVGEPLDGHKILSSVDKPAVQPLSWELTQVTQKSMTDIQDYVAQYSTAVNTQQQIEQLTADFKSKKIPLHVYQQSFDRLIASSVSQYQSRLYSRGHEDYRKYLGDPGCPKLPSTAITALQSLTPPSYHYNRTSGRRGIRDVGLFDIGYSPQQISHILDETGARLGTITSLKAQDHVARPPPWGDQMVSPAQNIRSSRHSSHNQQQQRQQRGVTDKNGDFFVDGGVPSSPHVRIRHKIMIEPKPNSRQGAGVSIINFAKQSSSLALSPSQLRTTMKDPVGGIVVSKGRSKQPSMDRHTMSPFSATLTVSTPPIWWNANNQTDNHLRNALSEKHRAEILQTLPRILRGTNSLVGLGQRVTRLQIKASPQETSPQSPPGSTRQFPLTIIDRILLPHIHSPERSNNRSLGRLRGISSQLAVFRYHARHRLQSVLAMNLNVNMLHELVNCPVPYNGVLYSSNIPMRSQSNHPLHSVTGRKLRLVDGGSLMSPSGAIVQSARSVLDTRFVHRIDPHSGMGYSIHQPIPAKRVSAEKLNSRNDVIPVQNYFPTISSHHLPLDPKTTRTLAQASTDAFQKGNSTATAEQPWQASQASEAQQSHDHMQQNTKDSLTSSFPFLFHTTSQTNDIVDILHHHVISTQFSTYDHGRFFRFLTRFPIHDISTNTPFNPKGITLPLDRMLFHSYSHTIQSVLPLLRIPPRYVNPASIPPVAMSSHLDASATVSKPPSDIQASSSKLTKNTKKDLGVPTQQQPWSTSESSAVVAGISPTQEATTVAANRWSFVNLMTHSTHLSSATLQPSYIPAYHVGPYDPPQLIPTLSTPSSVYVTNTLFGGQKWDQKQGVESVDQHNHAIDSDARSPSPSSEVVGQHHRTNSQQNTTSSPRSYFRAADTTTRQLNLLDQSIEDDNRHASSASALSTTTPTARTTPCHVGHAGKGTSPQIHIPLWLLHATRLSLDEDSPSLLSYPNKVSKRLKSAESLTTQSAKGSNSKYVQRMTEHITSHHDTIVAVSLQHLTNQLRM